MFLIYDAQLLYFYSNIFHSDQGGYDVSVKRCIVTVYLYSVPLALQSGALYQLTVDKCGCIFFTLSPVCYHTCTTLVLLQKAWKLGLQ